MGHLGAEELRRVQRGLLDHHGHALGLHALHDALDGARAEVVGVGFHRQVVDVHDGLRLAGAYAVPHHLQQLVGHEACLLDTGPEPSRKRAQHPLSGGSHPYDEGKGVHTACK